MLRSTRIVVLLGIAVQIAAFLRTAIIAATLGTSPDVDAYNLGLIAPTFISTVIGSWLQMSFVGRYTALLTSGQLDLAAAYRVRMLALILGCALLLAGLCFLFPGPIMGLFMPAGQTSMVASAAAALRLSGLILIPIIFGDFIAFILNSHGRFFAAAAAPLVNALVSVTGLLLWSHSTCPRWSGRCCSAASPNALWSLSPFQDCASAFWLRAARPSRKSAPHLCSACHCCRR